MNWGSSSQAQTYSEALSSIQNLAHVEEHVKNYRPQILALTGIPNARPALVDFAYLICKKNSLLMCGDIVRVSYLLQTYIKCILIATSVAFTTAQSNIQRSHPNVSKGISISMGSRHQRILFCYRQYGLATRNSGFTSNCRYRENEAQYIITRLQERLASLRETFAGSILCHYTVSIYIVFSCCLHFPTFSFIFSSLVPGSTSK